MYGPVVVNELIVKGLRDVCSVCGHVMRVPGAKESYWTKMKCVSGIHGESVLCFFFCFSDL